MGAFFSCGGQGLLSSCGARASHRGDIGCRSLGSVVVALELSCPTARGIFPDQGSSLCPLPWQGHQGSPGTLAF